MISIKDAYNQIYGVGEKMVMAIRDKKVPQSRHCEKCGKGFSTTDLNKTVCTDCYVGNTKRFCVKCGKEIDFYRINQDENCKWCSDKCMKALEKTLVIKKVRVCSECHKEISQKSNQVYDSSNKVWCHLMCKYKALKESIKGCEETIGSYQDDIKNTQKDIKSEEKDMLKHKDDIRKLAAEYPAEITMELL